MISCFVGACSYFAMTANMASCRSLLGLAPLTNRAQQLMQVIDTRPALVAQCGQVTTQIRRKRIDVALAATAGTHPFPVALSPSIPLATSSVFLGIEA